MSEATKEQLDKAHELGERDGKAKSDIDPPAPSDVATQLTDMATGNDSNSQINDSYNRGYTGGENQRDQDG